jgi:hypothetical protein
MKNVGMSKKKCRKNNVLNERFKCDKCNHCYQSNYALKKHYTSKKHLKEYKEITPKKHNKKGSICKTKFNTFTFFYYIDKKRYFKTFKTEREAKLAQRWYKLLIPFIEWNN